MVRRLPSGYTAERYLLFRAALEGDVCFGPDRRAKPTFVWREGWLERQPGPITRASALAELGRRYLAAYAPATPADLAAWSGLAAPDVRAAWEAVGQGLVEINCEGRTAWLPSERLAELDDPAPGPNHVRLLPAFDNYVLAYHDRTLIVAQEYTRRINAGGGLLKPVVLVDGEAVGTWRTNRQGRRAKITVDAFAELPTEVQAGIAAEVADIDRFLEEA